MIWAKQVLHLTLDRQECLIINRLAAFEVHSLLLSFKTDLKVGFHLMFLL